MLDRELEFTLNAAFRYAREKRHEFLTVEHLLLALLENSLAATVLKACGADVERLKLTLTIFLEEAIPVIPLLDSTRETQPTLGFQRVLQRAVFHAQSMGKAEVNGANLLAAIFSEQDSQAVHFLRAESITRLDIVNYISHGIAKVSPPEKREAPQDSSMEEDSFPEATGSPLDIFAVNLNLKAIAGQVDPLIGRENEISRTVQILCRRRKNNPLFVGEAGVGKTAIAEGLAKRIVEGDIPEVLSNSVIYALDLGSLLAGTKYRGDFEKRLKSVIQQLKSEPKSILFIDEIHTIIGAGAASGGVIDASNLIKPLLSSGEIKCMGSTTYQEYRSIFEKDRALARRFQKVDVSEPSIEESVQILSGLKPYFEAHHHLKYSHQAIKAAVELAKRYLNDRFLPDSAIDIIDEAAAYQALQPSSKRKKLIGVSEIEAIIAKIARIPSKTVTSSDKERLRNLERDLKMLIYGQEQAVEALSAAIKLARSGLGDSQKPVGSFLFAGPTGVGKTEVTRQLANLLGVELVRFDMSEYMEAHTVSRLIGAPPGYVGYNQGGLLTETITKHPHAVLLLDEIEKAHPDIFNLFLQVMDHGSLTDSNGRKADFRHVILVMTTNAGAELLTRSSVGFTQQDHSSDSGEAIKRAFSPEFRNRLDAIIEFKHLSFDTVVHVVDKFIMELELQLETKGVNLVVENSAREWLAHRGYDMKMGARPMARLIQEKIKRPLAEALLFGDLANGGSVLIKENNEQLEFEMMKQKSPVLEENQ